MAKEKVSPADVSAAAEKLLEGGIKVTIEGLQKQLIADRGQAGSYSDLGPLLKDWKIAKGAGATAEPIRIEVPASIREKSEVATVEMWAVATQMANEKLASEREAMDAERKSLQSDVAEGLAALDIKQEELDGERRLVENLHAASGLLSDDVESLKAKQAMLTDKLHQAEAALVERQRQIDTLTAERQALDATVRKLTEQTGKQAQQIEQLQDQAVQVKDLEKAIRTLEKEKSALEATITGEKVRTTDATARRDAVEAEMKTLHDEVRSLNAQLQEALRKKTVKAPVEKAAAVKTAKSVKAG